MVLVFYKITKRQENAVSKNPNYCVVNVNMEMFVGGGAIFVYFTMTKKISNLITGNMLIVSIRKGP